MTELSVLDRSWLSAHPLPAIGGETDKNTRGRVLVAGGSEFVPGALRLTAEAALRAGAGKVQIATVATAAIPLGVLFPEAAVLALPTDPNGEISSEAVPLLVEASAKCDAFVLGPGMCEHANAALLVENILAGDRSDLAVVLDAAAVACTNGHAAMLARHQGPLVLTPHYGEMASLTGIAIEEIERTPANIASDVAKRFNAVVALKGACTFISGPGGETVWYTGGGAGLATGGSGDVLAGIVGGLLARGADPLTAAGWAVWLHGESGRRAADHVGPIGFLARELLRFIPALLP